MATKWTNVTMNLRVFLDRLNGRGVAADSPYRAEVQFRVARESYCPKLYDSAIVLFQTTEQDEETRSRTVEQWTTLTSCPLEVRQVPGNHETMLLTPHVEVLASGLRDTLSKE